MLHERARAAAVLRWTGAVAGGTDGIGLPASGARRSSMRTSWRQGMFRSVLIDEPRALAQPQGCQRHVGRRGRQLPGAIAHGTKAELEKVDAFPPHRDLDHAVQLAQREGRRHQHAPPYHRADPDQPDLDLKDRLGVRRRRRSAAVLHRGLLRPSLHPVRLPTIPLSVPPTPEILMRSDGVDLGARTAPDARRGDDAAVMPDHPTGVQPFRRQLPPRRRHMGGNTPKARCGLRRPVSGGRSAMPGVESDRSAP